MITSTDPTGGPTQWKTAYVDHAAPIVSDVESQASLYGVSCASGLLCAAVDNGGNVLASIDPTGGPRAWTTHNLKLGYPLTLDGNPLTTAQIACPSISLCVAIGPNGTVVSATDPTGPASAWTVTRVDPDAPLTSLSCPSAKLCVAGDENGNVIVGTGPGPKGVARTAALAALTGALRHSCAQERLATILRRNRCTVPFAAPGPGQVMITWLDAHGNKLATGQLTTATRAKLAVQVSLTRTGKRLLHRARRATRLWIRATFLDAAGNSYTKTTTVTLSRQPQAP